MGTGLNKFRIRITLMDRQRNFSSLGNTEFDILIIGGGISGICIAYDAALQGYNVALVDKGDFGAATSTATSKLIHGGLRYLKQMDFKVVRESLRERKILMDIAPHLVYPFPFIIPTYKKGNTKTLLRIGLTLYDLLGYDSRKVRDTSKRMPKHKVLTKEEVVKLEPSVSTKDLTGGILYYDSQMPDPNRLTWSFALSAHSQGVTMVNYAEVQDFEILQEQEQKRIQSAIVYDHETGEKISVRAKVFINAAGPWADKVLAMSHGQAEKNVMRSKGIHVITKPVVKNHAIGLRTSNGRHFFIIPWRGYSLLGTTDVEYKGSPDELKVTKTDIQEFLEEVNAAYPGAGLSEEDVLHSYVGIRPLVDSDTKVSSYKASRKYEIYDHEKEDQLAGLISVIGGKYTTSRQLGIDVMEHVKKHLHQPPIMNPNRLQPLVGGDTGFIENFVKEEKEHNHYGLKPEVFEYHIRNYGTLYKEMLGYAEKDSSLAKTIFPDQKEIWAQVHYAVNKEWAVKLTDVVLRRTAIATARNLDRDIAMKIAKEMAKIIGWSNDRIRKEVDEYFSFIELG